MTAAERVTKYLGERLQMRGIDQEQIAGLHGGHEREALLLVSDLREVLARLEVAQRMADALREILRVHADDNKRPKAFYIADAALAEWEKQQ